MVLVSYESYGYDSFILPNALVCPVSGSLMTMLLGG
ncbi:hypothetical protein HDF15_004543 [Granulicella mallensis]|uniref:Uncharacterized protein n=1 Tax=Granulicella mallensis TaxID=940614 RepID=A0A7W8EC22_9BACT|nr:hypothetical protein [Granulicella mallensis]